MEHDGKCVFNIMLLRMPDDPDQLYMVTTLGYGRDLNCPFGQWRPHNYCDIAWPYVYGNTIIPGICVCGRYHQSEYTTALQPLMMEQTKRPVYPAHTHNSVTDRWRSKPEKVLRALAGVANMQCSQDCRLRHSIEPEHKARQENARLP